MEIVTGLSLLVKCWLAFCAGLCKTTWRISVNFTENGEWTMEEPIKFQCRSDQIQPYLEVVIYLGGLIQLTFRGIGPCKSYVLYWHFIIFLREKKTTFITFDFFILCKASLIKGRGLSYCTLRQSGNWFSVSIARHSFSYVIRLELYFMLTIRPAAGRPLGSLKIIANKNKYKQNKQIQTQKGLYTYHQCF